jgi:3'-5' exoribonuclease
MDVEARDHAQLTGEPAALFPEPLRVLIEHMILAHHGRLEFGSPKLPMTPEAMLLSALDDLEAKFQAMRTEFAAARDAGRRPDEPTEWVRSMERNLFDSRRFLEAQTSSLSSSAPPPAAAPEAPDSAPEPVEPGPQLEDLFTEP